MYASGQDHCAPFPSIDILYIHIRFRKGSFAFISDDHCYGIDHRSFSTEGTREAKYLIYIRLHIICGFYADSTFCTINYNLYLLSPT